jgi:hypothetical protein
MVPEYGTVEDEFKALDWCVELQFWETFGPNVSIEKKDYLIETVAEECEGDSWKYVREDMMALVIGV